MKLGDAIRTAVRSLVIVIVVLVSGVQACDAQSGFPEDRKIAGPIEVGREWKVIEVDQPLEINREGLQGLHIVVDPDEFTSNSDHEDELSNHPDHFFDLRNHSGELVVPEVVMVAPDGTQVELGSISNIYLYEGGLTVGMGMVSGNVYKPSPLFPEGIASFSSFRVRSNVPFTAKYLWWMVERHPDMFR